MPTIEPYSDEVAWPPNEGVIGVVGVAPWATLDFLRALYSLVPATKDWHYPRVLADINCKLPSRGRYLELGERDPSPFIADTILELARAGADVVVVPCNTAHILYDRWAMAAPVSVPSIITATVESIVTEGSKSVAVFGSQAIYRHDLYGKALTTFGIREVKLSEAEQAIVVSAIEEVKKTSVVSDATRAKVAGIVAELKARGADGVILGCTELAGLLDLCRSAEVGVADSNGSLARAALRAARITMRGSHR